MRIIFHFQKEFYFVYKMQFSNSVTAEEKLKNTEYCKGVYFNRVQLF